MSVISQSDEALPKHRLRVIPTDGCGRTCRYSGRAQRDKIERILERDCVLTVITLSIARR